MKRAIFAAPLLLVAVVTACRSSGQSPGGGAPDAGQPAASASVPALPPRPAAAPGELLADLEESQARVSMVKDRDVANPVVGTVRLRDGRLTLGGPAPSARLVFDILTFDSRIPLRNERVKKIFFETPTTGYDTLELVVPKLPEAALAALRKDRKATGIKLEGEVRVHGGKSKLTMVVDAAYEKDGGVSVKTPAPVELKISDLGLSDNLRRLSQLCMHDSIDDLVKIQVTLLFPPG